MRTEAGQRRLRILLVEDNPGDAWMTEEALKDGPVPVEVLILEDGQAALDHLRGQASSPEGVLPHIVLLDLNLPGKSGFEVLEEVRCDARLAHLPIIILSSSTYPEDVERAYRLHANCYVAKAETFERLIREVRCLKEFWGSVAVLPRSGSLVS